MYSSFPYILCIAITVILHFLDVSRYGRKHMQLTLIKMAILAAVVTAFTVETRPGGLIFAPYSVTCKFMLNAMLFCGKQYDIYPRKNCCTKRCGAHFPPCLSLPRIWTAEVRLSVGIWRCSIQSSPSPRAPFSPALPSTHLQSVLEPLVSSCNCIIL